MKQLLLPVFLLLAALAPAQCPTFFKCPLSGQTIQDDISNNDATLWNATEYWDTKNLSHDLAETPVRVFMLATDLCIKNTLVIRFVLTLDLNNDGVPETVVDSDNLPAAAGVIFSGAPGGVTVPFDNRNVSNDQKYRFAIERQENDFATHAQLKWNTDAEPYTYHYPQLPNGKHHIEWTAEADGVQSSCAYDIVVQDKAGPEIFCAANLSVNIMPTGMINLWASDFLLYAVDNITPTNDLELGVRRAGQGTGFPLDAQGNPQTSVFFTCEDLGTQVVELWVKDNEGNESYCESIVEVQDLFSICNGGGGDLVTVCVQNYCNGEGIEEAGFSLSGASPGIPTLFLLGVSTDGSGCEDINFSTLPIQNNNALAPVKDDNPLNGISTFDMIKIGEYLSGDFEFTNPWQYVAADINRDNVIDSLDITDLSKLILGIYTELPDNTSWRFFVPGCEPDINMPLPPGCAEAADVNVIMANEPYVFTGVKIGDINCSAVSNNVASRGIIQLEIPDLFLSAGQTVEVPLTFADAASLAGFQLELHSAAGLEILEIIGLKSGAAFRHDATRWAISHSGAVPHLSLRLHANAALRLSEALRLQETRIRPEAYTQQGDVLDLELQFRHNPVLSGQLSVIPPQPNPTSGEVILTVEPAQASTVTVELLNISGRVCWSNQQELRGAQVLTIPAEAMPQAGLYFWRVRSGESVVSGKLVRL